MGWRRYGLVACIGCSSGNVAGGSVLSGLPDGTSGTAGASDSGDAVTTEMVGESADSGLASTSGSSSGGASTSSGSADSGSSSTGAPADGPNPFDEDPGWMSFNLPLGGNDYGWRATAIAGGDAGEIGGHFQRPDSLSYYADVDIAVDSEAAIAAAGRINVVAVEDSYNYNTFFGHFSTADPGGARLGVEILEPSGGEARIRLMHGVDAFVAFELQELAIDRDWSYAYDPSIGDYGQMVLSIEGQEMASIELTADDRAAIANLDAFGLVTPASDNAGDYPGLLEVYFDDIDYTR